MGILRIIEELLSEEKWYTFCQQRDLIIQAQESFGGKMTRGQTNNVEVVIPATTSNIANIEEYWSTLKSSTKRNQQPPDNATAHSRASSPNDYINIQLDEA